MRISPELLARLLAYSFLAGVVLSLINALARSMTVLIDGKSLCKNSKLESAILKLYSSCRDKRGSVKKAKKENRLKNLFCILKQVYNFIVDFSLFILAGVAVILLCYYLNYGEFRGFCVFGMACGFLLCRITVGKALIIAFGELNLLVRFLIFFSVRITLAPLTIFLNFCKKLLKFFNIKIINTLEKNKKVLYNNNELLYIYKLSEKGFGILSVVDDENNDSIIMGERENGTYEKSR